MNPLNTWTARDAAPLTPQDCHVQSFVAHSHAAGTPAHMTDTIERLLRAAARWDSVARRLEWARPSNLDAADDAACMVPPGCPAVPGAHLAGA